MVKFNFTFDPNVSLEQRIGFEMAAAIWSSYLTDDVTINLRIGATTGLNGNQAVGGAIPIFHEQHYGVYRNYVEQDITSTSDQEASQSLQDGNTVDVLIDGQVVNGNTSILLTSAQAKALGMSNPLQLNNGTTWNRDLVDSNALDGYIVINNSFNWSYDLTRSQPAAEGTLDFLSMALHEIGHNLGFVSGMDGTIDLFQMFSGETRVEGFTALDMFRHTIDSQAITNPDGSVNDLTLGANSYFSLDGGTTNLGEFSTGQSGDGFQASHWQRFQQAIGVMDPTLAYKERLSISYLDLQAIDALGWDINYNSFNAGLNLQTLLTQAEAKVATDLGLGSGFFNTNVEGNDLYTLSYTKWWAIMEQHMLDLGYTKWWQVLQLGYTKWWQNYDNQTLSSGDWWNAFEQEILALGYTRWWQEFEEHMLALGYTKWWQLFELGYTKWWQQVETHASTMIDLESSVAVVTNPDSTQTSLSGGSADDILGGSVGRDLIAGNGGDDLIDGKAGNDLLLGNEGNDILYGWGGNDILYGGAGDDLLAGEDHDDILYGEAGADILSGGRGNDVLNGGEGRDVLKGEAGDDLLDGSTEDDDLDGGGGNDLLLGGSGRDRLIGGHGNDILYGDASFNDTNTLLVYGTNTWADASFNDTNTLLVYGTNTWADASFNDINTLLVYGTNTWADADTTLPDFWVRLELENWKLTNYNLDEQTGASGTGVVSTRGKGKVRTNFNGPTGTYDLVVGYYDDGSGVAGVTLSVGGSDYTWQLNGTAGQKTYKISGVTIRSGERLELRSQAKGSDYARLDYLDVITAGAVINNIADAQAANSNFYQSVGGNDGQSQAIRLEAETFSLTGGYINANRDFASQNSVIVNPGANQGKATLTFTENSGMYNLYANYWDSSLGSATAKILLNGTILNSWQLTANDNSAHHRTVGLGIVLNQGDVLEIQGLANGGEQVEIDYLELQKIDNLDNGDADLRTLIKVEAEAMTLTGKAKITQDSDASGGYVVETDNSAHGLTATTIFTGVTGLYDIEVGYFDDQDGNAPYRVILGGGQVLDSWISNLKLGHSTVGQQNFVNRTAAYGVLLNQGDSLILESFRDSNDRAYIDYVKFVPHDPLAKIRVEAEYLNLTGSSTLGIQSFASGGRVIGSSSTTASNQVRGQTTFRGKAGNYNIVVAYYDENDGNAQFTAKVRGTQLDSWVANQNLRSSSVSVATLATRTIANVSLNPGDVVELTSLRQSGDYGYIDYIEFISVEAPVPETFNIIQIEAEQMNLSGDFDIITSANFAQGGAFIEADDDARASTLFQGETGYYDIVVGYYDENDGVAEIQIKVDNRQIDRWFADQNLGTSSPSTQSFITRTVGKGVKIDHLDLVEILVSEHLGDQGNIDFIRFIPVEAPTSFQPVQIVSSDNSDFLEGGSGNDTLYGGEGNDTLNGTSDGLFGFGEQDILVGGSGVDLFVLGERGGAYYAQGGYTDYAVIQDFVAGVDRVQLYGAASNYQLQVQGGNTLLFGQGQDLVAQFTGLSWLSLTSSSFTFVS